MAIVTPHNRWWWDVLENGPLQPLRRLLRRGLGPARGAAAQHRAAARARRPLRPRARSRRSWRSTAAPTAFMVRYHEHAWPMAPALGRRLLAPRRRSAASDELAFIADAHGRLDARPPRRRRRASAGATATRRCCKALVERLCRERPEVAAAVDAEIAARQRRTGRARRAARAPELPPRLLAHGLPRPRVPPLLRREHAWPACASRWTASSSTPTTWCWAGCATAPWTACASTIPTACAIPRATSTACRTRGRAPGWWWRRSSSPASGCPRTGPSTAPPATTSWPACPRCSSIPRARSR